MRRIYQYLIWTETLRFHGTTQYSFIRKFNQFLGEKKAAANIVVGPIAGESGQLLFAKNGMEAEAIQVTGTGRAALYLG